MQIGKPLAVATVALKGQRTRSPSAYSRHNNARKSDVVCMNIYERRWSVRHATQNNITHTSKSGSKPAESWRIERGCRAARICHQKVRNTAGIFTQRRRRNLVRGTGRPHGEQVVEHGSAHSPKRVPDVVKTGRRWRDSRPGWALGRPIAEAGPRWGQRARALDTLGDQGAVPACPRQRSHILPSSGPPESSMCA